MIVFVIFNIILLYLDQITDILMVVEGYYFIFEKSKLDEY